MNIGKPDSPTTFEREIGSAVAGLLEVERKRAARRDRQFRTAEGWLFNLSMLLLGDWLLMILVGVVHADWIPALPTVSFGTASVVFVILFWICVVVRTVMGPGARGRS